MPSVRDDVGAAERDPAQRRIDRHAAVRVPRRQRGMRLERNVLDHLRTEAAFEDPVGLGEPLLDVALLDDLVPVDVRVGRVHARSLELQRHQRIEHRRERLVLDLDLLERFGGNLLGHGCDRGDAVAGMKDARIGQHRLVLERRPERVAGNVATRHHGHDARHRFGFLRVDADDSRRRDACPLDLGVQHARHIEVVDVLGLAQSVETAVGPGGTLAHRRCLLLRLRNEHFERQRRKRRRGGSAQHLDRRARARSVAVPVSTTADFLSMCGTSPTRTSLPADRLRGAQRPESPRSSWRIQCTGTDCRPAHPGSPLRSDPGFHRAAPSPT